MSRSVSMSKFYCLGCGHKMVLPRRESLRRGKGHLKKVYCIRCREEVNHLEVREIDIDFDIDVFLEDLRNGKYQDIVNDNREGTLLYGRE